MVSEFRRQPSNVKASSGGVCFELAKRHRENVPSPAMNAFPFAESTLCRQSIFISQKANITSSSVPSSPSTQRIRAVQRTAGWTAKRVVICLQSVCNHLQCTDTYGAWGPQGLKLTKEIGKKISEVAHEKRSTFFLIQRIRIAIQRGNAACLLGTAPASETLDEVFDFVEHSSEI